MPKTYLGYRDPFLIPDFKAFIENKQLKLNYEAHIHEFLRSRAQERVDREPYEYKDSPHIVKVIVKKRGAFINTIWRGTGGSGQRSA